MKSLVDKEEPNVTPPPTLQEDDTVREDRMRVPLESEMMPGDVIPRPNVPYPSNEIFPHEFMFPSNQANRPILAESTKRDPLAETSPEAEIPLRA
jgi:hypothetical protein